MTDHARPCSVPNESANHKDDADGPLRKRNWEAWNSGPDWSTEASFRRAIRRISVKKDDPQLMNSPKCPDEQLLVNHLQVIHRRAWFIQHTVRSSIIRIIRKSASTGSLLVGYQSAWSQFFHTLVLHLHRNRSYNPAPHLFQSHPEALVQQQCLIKSQLFIDFH